MTKLFTPRALVTRRAFGLSAASAATIPLLGASAFAQPRELEIRGGQFRPVNIAVTNFVGDGQQGAALSEIIVNNFRRSVYLSRSTPKRFPTARPIPIRRPIWTPGG